MDLGPTELLIVLAIALLLFGGAKLPKLARSMGEASREFKKGVDGHKDDSHKEDETPTKPIV
jgi:sec-independent protein translocase protein TatA